MTRRAIAYQVQFTNPRKEPDQSLAPITVSLVHELPDQWRIDLPNNVSGQMLHDHLLTALTDIGEHSDKWPANEQDAYRCYTHRVLMAAYGAPTADAVSENMSGSNSNK